MGLFFDLFKSKKADPAKPLETSASAARGASDAEKNSGATSSSTIAHPVSAASRSERKSARLHVPDSEVKLILADVIHRIPSHFLKPGPHDLKRPLVFHIHDLFSDIVRGRATVPLSKIAQLCPEIFRDHFDVLQDMEVHLPLQKLVEQVGAFPTRNHRAEGGKSPVQESVRGQKNSEKNSGLDHSSQNEKLQNQNAAPREPTVDAGSMSSEEFLLSAPATGNDAHNKKPPSEKPFLDENILLNFAAIVRAMPQEAIIGELEPIAESFCIALPYEWIEAQIPSGKIELAPNDFIDALPPEYRVNFARGATVKIPIPLEEIRAAQSRSAAQNSLEKQVATIQPPAAPTDLPSPSAAAKKPSEGEQLKSFLDLVQDSTAVTAAEESKPAEIAPPSTIVHDLSLLEKPDFAAPERAPAEIFSEKELSPIFAAVPLQSPLETQNSEEEIPDVLQNQIRPEPFAEAVPALPIPEPVSEIELSLLAPPEPTPQSLPVMPNPPASDAIASPLARPIVVPPLRLFAQPASSEKPAARLVSEPPDSSLSLDSLQPIFETDEPLDAAKIAQRICQFSGIQACVIATKKNLIQGGAVPFDFNLEEFRLNFSSFAHSVCSYANKFKIAPMHDFTLDCERFAVSFFPQGEACLCVFCNERNLSPDVPAKLRRIIEELARII